MVPKLLLLRYLGRIVGNMVLARQVGARDRLCHYDKGPVWIPDKPIGMFMRDALKAQGLAREYGAIKSFLDYWQPIQSLSFLDKSLIEFSLTTHSPGIGMMLYGESRRMARAFDAYCRAIGIYNSTVDLCCAICDTFRASDLGMVRAEFKPGEQVRYSIASSWYFDILRSHSGFNEKVRRLPKRFRSRGLVDSVRAYSEALEPHYYPLFFGLSFLQDGTLESKMYLVRFDDEKSPFHPGSTLWRFVQSMDMPSQEMARLKEITDLVWASSKDKMTQIAIEVAEGQVKPKRVNFIYCGTPLSAVKQAIGACGLTDVPGTSTEAYRQLMQADHVKYVGIRVTPKGVSPQFKLYGQAMFNLTEPYVCADGLTTAASA